MRRLIQRVVDKVMTKDANFVYQAKGHCPICELDVDFTSIHGWYRDHLLCSRCGSIPRERALTLVLQQHFPGWRESAIHESSPGNRGLSPKLNAEAVGYIPTQFFPNKAVGEVYRGVRNENLEKQTFGDAEFDLVITQDVMEHVNDPKAVFDEIRRTLKPDGGYLFTVPTYKQLVESERKARYHNDGTVEYFAEAEYHGNPIEDSGSLVTFHYGYDLAELIHKWSGLNVEVIRFHDPLHGIIGEFTETYVARNNRK